MTLRKILFMNAEAVSEEQVAGDTLKSAHVKVNGNVELNSNSIIDVSDATLSGHPLVFGQADAELNGLDLTAALNLGNDGVVRNVGNGTDATDAVNVSQIDDALMGISWRPAVRALRVLGDDVSEPVDPQLGDAYISTGAEPYAPGNPGYLVEWNGSSWVFLNGWSEAERFRFIVGAGATGSFAGHDGQIAYAPLDYPTNSTWLFEANDEGDAVTVAGGAAGRGDSVYTARSYARTETGAWVQIAGAGQYLAGAGLSLDGRIYNVNFGDGLKNADPDADYIAVELYSNGGLELTGTTPDAQLQVMLHATTPCIDIDSGLKLVADGAHGIDLSGNKIAVKIDNTGFATASIVDGDITVVGVKSGFKVNGDSTVDVIAASLSELTGGGSTSLHMHPNMDKGARIENTVPAGETLLAGQPVYWSDTDTVGKARADTDAKAWVTGVARTGATSPDPVEVVSIGVCAGVLSSANPGDQYFLSSSGGLQTTVPTGGKRVVLCGIAMNATDLLVQIRDYGKKVA